MPIRVQVADTARDRHAVFRLRYDVYVEELGREQHYADHARLTIEEPLDAGGMLLAAFDGERLAGTLRINYSRNSELGDYASLYQMARVGLAHPAHTSITTKLLVSSDYRNTTLAYRLSMAAFQHGLPEAISFNFIDVYPGRVAFFERLGYHVHVPEMQHPEFGAVVVMRVDVLDADHFRRVGSPFLRFLQRAQAAA